MFYITCSVIVFFITLDQSEQLKQYRTDYEYNYKTDAFYKFHIETLKFSEARKVCENEGADLMVPTSDYDVSQVHGMFKPYPDIGPYAWVASDGKEHESSEQKVLIDLFNSDTADVNYGQNDNECDVITRDGEVQTSSCYRQMPFVCKVAAKDAFFDAHCSVFGKDYQYFETVGSCYKIPKIVYSWNQAYADCQAQGAHLVVLNSEIEHQVIRNFTNATPGLKSAKTTWFFIAGIRAQIVTDGSPIVFRTIFNQTLEEAGYSRWSANEPNNALGNEYCGTIFKNDGNYNDIDCSHYYAFICEKEVKNQ